MSREDIPSIPNRNAAGFRDCRTGPGEERAMFAPHAISDGGVIRYVQPALGMTFGHMHAIGSDEMQPTIRIDHAMGPLSLLFVPSAHDLRVFGQAMLDTAADMEPRASDMLADALKRGQS